MKVNEKKKKKLGKKFKRRDRQTDRKQKEEGKKKRNKPRKQRRRGKLKCILGQFPRLSSLCSITDAVLSLRARPLCQPWV